MRVVHLESPVGMATADGAAVWSFDLDHWGVCEQGHSIDEALSTWTARHGPATVAEELSGDEQAFVRDLEPATDAELERTLTILDDQRSRTLGILDGLPDRLLDFDDPERALPRWARWRTIRQTLWHICDTESRYYLPQTGLPARERLDRLPAELRASHRHVRSVLASMPRDTVNRPADEVWTATKLLRRLAWHERGELAAIGELLAGWRA